MNPLERLWQWTTASTGPTLSPSTWLVLVSCAWLVAVGAFLLESSEAQRRDLLARLRRHSSIAAGQAGRSEYRLRTELRIKLGVALIAWATALALSILLRLLATPGLTTHILTAIVLAALPLWLGYFLIYRLVLYPRYLAVCRRVDTRQAYMTSAGKTKNKAKGSATRTTRPASAHPRVETLPGKALAAAVILPFVYYFALAPTNPVHDHALHQLGMLVMVPLGLLIGLVWSLGDGVRSGAFWVTPRQR